MIAVFSILFSGPFKANGTTWASLNSLFACASLHSKARMAHDVTGEWGGGIKKSAKVSFRSPTEE